MKNNIYILFTAFVIMLVSCKKDFLYESDPTRLSTDNFYKNTTEINQALNGSYSQLQDIVNSQWLFNELITDNTTVDFNPADRGQADRIEAFEYWTVNSGSLDNTAMYDRHYNAIYNINVALEKMQNAVDVPDSAKQLFEGQFKFLRAYYYFQLTQYYGDVVLILETFSDPAEAYKYERVPAADVYKQIEADLTESISDLPMHYTASEVGRATKGAAAALLGKVYLTEKKYAEAETILKTVTSMGYSLNANYADNFDPLKKNGPESVFEVQYSSVGTVGEWSGFIYTFAPRQSGGAVTGFSQSNPGGWNIPTKDMIATYEAGDLRKDASVGLDYTRTSPNEVIPYIKKYAHQHSVYGRTDDNWPVLRYSDVLLMLAEAINEQNGPTTEAYTYINEVRKRANLNDLSGLNQAQFRDTLVHERRVELAFENWRWFDLKRTKTPAELTAFMNAYGAKEKANPTVSRQGIPFSTFDYQFSETEALYPIPSDEILVNKSLQQNDGY